MDEAKRDLFFVILFLLGLAIVWNFTGGPSRPSATSGPILKQPLEKHEKEIETGARKISGESPATVPTINSAYKYRVLLLAGQGARNSNPQKEYIEIQAVPGNDTVLNISEWALEGSSGLRVKLGKGSSLAYPGRLNSQNSIFLNQGEKAYAVSGESPIGTSFRLNKCSGYLEQFQDFAPAIPKRCPLPRDENPPARLDSACLDYISRLPRCEMPVGNIPANLSSACLDYLGREINYAACVRRHENDADFYDSEWRIYLGKNKELWKNGMETIILRDENGRAIDWASY